MRKQHTNADTQAQAERTKERTNTTERGLGDAEADRCVCFPVLWLDFGHFCVSFSSPSRACCGFVVRYAYENGASVLASFRFRFRSVAALRMCIVTSTGALFCSWWSCSAARCSCCYRCCCVCLLSLLLVFFFLHSSRSTTPSSHTASISSMVHLSPPLPTPLYARLSSSFLPTDDTFFPTAPRTR